MKTIAIVVVLLLELQPNVGPALLSSLGESAEIVLADLVLVPPEQSYEGPVGAVLSLGLPAVIVDLAHSVIRDSLRYLCGHPLLELFDQVGLALLLVIDGRLLEAINDPLAVAGRNVDLVLLQEVDGRLGDFVELLLEGPVLLVGVLGLVIERINMLDVVVGHHTILVF